MRVWAGVLGFVVLLVVTDVPVPAQRNIAGAVRTRLALEALNVVGNALMIGAHPDDENTALLAYLARGRHVRTAYLAATRGEGGQNLIGSEQGDLLGLIRTQELLAARRIDGAEQFFTRAVDFGFSKTAEETLAKWNRDQVLADIVWNIRRFRPDVIIIQHTGTPADGHGNHQAIGILGREAFVAAADRSRFPEQLRFVEPWQARRMLGRGGGPGSTGQIVIDTGEFDPVLGFSYSEVAGMSRSMHKSQGMGAPEQRGASRSSLSLVAGEPAKNDVFDGIDMTWNRLPGGAAAGRILDEALHAFQPDEPGKVIPMLIKARPLLAGIPGPQAVLKLKELDEAIALCAGLWLDATADRHAVVPGDELQVSFEAINRSKAALSLAGVNLEGMSAESWSTDKPAALAYNEPLRHSLKVKVPIGHPYSQPYWLQKPHSGDTYVVENQEWIGLAETPAVLRVLFRISIGPVTITLERPAVRRYVDRVDGETSRALVVVPGVSIGIPEQALIFPDAKGKAVEVILRSNAPGVAGDLSLAAPPGWTVQPASTPFKIAEADEQTSLNFSITPPAHSTVGTLRATAHVAGLDISSDMHVIAYPGYPIQTVFPPAQAKLVRADIRNLAKKVGYIMGAGDEVPGSLRQMGCDVTLLGSDDLTAGDLGRFDALVTGVRAYNVRADLRANQKRLLEYVQQGGTLVVQYNVVDRRAPTMQGIGPYPMQLGSDRVSVEEAPVTFRIPGHAVLSGPNKITEEDFQGWVQERGLNFASQWDPRYEALFESHDPNEKPLDGGTLYVPYGKGSYIFTAYSWFRQLPAGVPGAFRIFADFMSSGKASAQPSR
jgi:LmbE family N-acetylglucosaminyl deacetylase